MQDGSVHSAIQADVRGLAEEHDLEEGRAFAVWALRIFHELEIDDAYGQTEVVDGRICGWHKDNASKTFYLWQCKWTPDEAVAFDESASEEFLNTFESILHASEAADFEPALVKMGLEVAAAVEHGYTLALEVAVPTVLRKAAMRVLKTRAVRHVAPDLGPLNVEVVAAGRLLEMRNEREDNDIGDLADTTVTFRLRDGSCMVLEPPALPADWRAAVVALAGESIADAAAEHGNRLFHLNVRYALSHRLARIQSIRETLASEDKARFFWFYNNGLTILCDHFAIQKNSISIENPQVVNGCQTVNAFLAKRPVPEYAASVLARVIELPDDPQERERQAREISRWTNSQVPVLGRDLHSNDPIQRTIQSAFDALTPPWFYEVKRGEWAAVSKNKDRRVRYGNRRVGMDEIGQCYRMLETPAEALTKKKELFEDETIYEGVFESGRGPKEYLFPYLCWAYYDRFWHSRNMKAIHEACGTAFSDEQVRRLLRAKGQVVAHSVALTRLLFQADEFWSATDAEMAFAAFLSEKLQVVAWTRHIGVAFAGFMRVLDNINEERRNQGIDELSVKKRLEESGQRALRELWSSISANAAILLGSSWKAEIVGGIGG